MMDRLEIPEREEIDTTQPGFVVTYGPDALTPLMLQGMASGIAQMAEAERHLEELLRNFIGGPSKAKAAILGEFRGHRALLSIIQTCYQECGENAAANALNAIKPKITQVWQLRDKLAHGIWARSGAYPDGALLISPKEHGKTSIYAAELLAIGDVPGFMKAWQSEKSEIWTADTFDGFARCARGAVNAIMLLSACISQNLPEDDWRYQALRSLGLIAEPPWKLQPPENNHRQPAGQS